MKTKWQTKNFEDCLDKVVYTNKIQRKDFLASGSFPIVSQEAEAINGYWNNKKDLFQSKTPVVVFGDHTQVLKYIDFDFVLGADGVKILKPKIFLDPRFFYYFLQSIKLKNLGYARHYRLLKELDISYPESISEQKRIVKVLDDVFEQTVKLKESAENNLLNTRELFDSYLQNIFAKQGENWEEQRLADVCEKITDGTHQTPTYFDEGIIFLSSGNVTSGKINWEKIKYIDKKQHLEMHKRVAPRLNDILLAKNGTTGVAALVDRDTVFDIYVSLALLRAREMILPTFLLYFVNSKVAKKQFNKRLKGSGVPNLHLEEIREVIISFPKSIAEQKSIVKKLDELSEQTKKLEEIYKQKLLDLEELKKSVLHKAFTGEL
jgi:type I restriction enzyme S subunit